MEQRYQAVIPVVQDGWTLDARYALAQMNQALQDDDRHAAERFIAKAERALSRIEAQ